MSTMNTTINLQLVHAEINRMVASHRALLDELENRIRALDPEIANVRAARRLPS
jgi:hypothetical protein